MEYWDIYDRMKRPTGRTMKRNDWILKDGEYHLSVLALIMRPDGRYLITKRIETKHWAPGWWEIPGGGVMAGETSRQAISREVLEETGLDVSGIEAEPVLTYHRENPGEGDNYFVDVYRFVLDFKEEDVHIQSSESTAFRIVTAQEMKELDDQGIFLHYKSICQVIL